MNKIKNENYYLITNKIVIADLTCNTRQLKSERIEKKLRYHKDNHMEARYSKTYQNTGHDLTPLLSEKIQYVKIIKGAQHEANKKRMLTTSADICWKQ